MISSIDVFQESSKISPKKKRSTASNILSAPTIIDCIQQEKAGLTTTPTTRICYFLVCIHEPKTVEVWKIFLGSSTNSERVWSSTMPSLSASSDFAFLTTSPIRANPIVIDKNAVILSFQDGSMISLNPLTSTASSSSSTSNEENGKSQNYSYSLNWRNTKGAKSWGFNPTLIRFKNDEMIVLHLIFAGYRDDDITIYLGNSNDEKNLNQGRILGKIPKSDGVWSAPLVDVKTMRMYFALTASARVVCVDLSEFLKQLLKFSSSSSTSSSATITTFPKLWEFDIVPNAVSYKQQIPFWIWTTPALSCHRKIDGDSCFVAFGCVDGVLRIVSAQNGKLVTALKHPKDQKKSGISLSPVVMASNDDKREELILEINDRGVVRSISTSSFHANTESLQPQQSLLLLFSPSSSSVFDPDDTVIFTQKINSIAKSLLVVSQRGWVFVLSPSSAIDDDIFSIKIKSKLCLFSSSQNDNNEDRGACGKNNKNNFVTSASFHDESGILLAATRQQDATSKSLGIKIVKLETLIPELLLMRNVKNENNKMEKVETQYTKVVANSNLSNYSILSSLDESSSNILQVMLLFCGIVICLWVFRARAKK